MGVFASYSNLQNKVAPTVSVRLVVEISKSGFPYLDKYTHLGQTAGRSSFFERLFANSTVLDELFIRALDGFLNRKTYSNSKRFSNLNSYRIP